MRDRRCGFSYTNRTLYILLPLLLCELPCENLKLKLLGRQLDLFGTEVRSHISVRSIFGGGLRGEHQSS